MPGASAADDASRHAADAPDTSDAEAPRPRPLPIAILISGQGTNLNAILHARRTGALDVDVRLVVSNRADAPGLRYCHDAGVPHVVISRSDFPTRDAQQRALL